MAADDINIAEEAFRRYDEHIVVEDPLDRNSYHAFSDIYQVPMSDQIFVAQSNVIRWHPMAPVLLSAGVLIWYWRTASIFLFMQR